jgi:hypothetical protein
MTKNIYALLATTTLAGSALASPVNITVENMLADGSFYFTPVWMALHDGSFDVYDNGAASADFPGLTDLAENGNTGPLGGAFAASPAGLAGGVHTTLFATDGPDGAPVFAPGESASVLFDAGDSSLNRYFSYASMVIPSNDLFFAAADPMGIEIFDAAGNFNGPMEILIFGGDVRDNGTELNSAINDAAFSALDGQSIPENVLIRSLFGDPGDQAYLDSFIGTQVATGDTLLGSFGAGDLIARITIVPTPSTAALIGLSGLVGLGRRRAC